MSSMPWVADAHTDYLSRVSADPNALYATLDTQRHISLPALQQGGVGLQVFAIFVDAASPRHPTVQCLKQLYAFQRMFSVWGPSCVRAAELDTLAHPFHVPLRAILSLEGGEACDGSTELLHIFASLGVRAMAPVWNYRNVLGHPAVEKTAEQKGLTTCGKRMLDAMNRLGVAIDVSHMNCAGFWDCMQRSTVPVFASHSNAYALCPHPRNLDDAQIKALIRAKGFIGLNFSARLLSPNGHCTLEALVRHALHILDLGGEDALGFGSDFDGVARLPNSVRGAQDFPLILRALAEAGLPRTVLDKVAHQNLVRYLSRFF